MAKSSSGGSRNDSRSNGKAEKKNPGRKTHGSKAAQLNDIQKVLMGKGLAVKYARSNAEGARAQAGKRNNRKS